MNQKNEKKIMKMSKAIVQYLLLLAFIFGLFYLLVYKVAFLPFGYDIISTTNDHVVLKSSNIFGLEKERITVSFPYEDAWNEKDFEDAVKNEKDHYWLFFSFLTLSIFLLISKIRKGVKIWSAIFQSNILIALVFSLTLYNSIRYIELLISFVE